MGIQPTHNRIKPIHTFPGLTTWAGQNNLICASHSDTPNLCLSRRLSQADTACWNLEFTQDTQKPILPQISGMWLPTDNFLNLCRMWESWLCLSFPKGSPMGRSCLLSYILSSWACIQFLGSSKISNTEFLAIETHHSTLAVADMD